ncbi:hypothetical protein JJB11_11270 [Ramlibacter ginsenosidimutans]|uniref:Thymidylate kinase n=1 Tax=Ramlibacter ginsenosidimutans TaxID=502333 RepID=A0A934TSG7_9BURK|nr:hypothetical protein [Ramlibacter ginsenosidimutans]MBK6006672.1 hypothetical protein [Ramlibacter ginsenosidimutans]
MMKKELSALVTGSVSAVMPVLGLRGTDDFARVGGDLDFIVPAGHAVEACRTAARAATDAGWYLLFFRDIGYLAQIVLVRPSDTGEDHAIKVDFFDGLRWYGIGRDDAGRTLLEQTASMRGDPKVVGAVSFFQKTMTVGRCSERDWARVQATGADKPYLLAVASNCGLPLTAEQLGTRGPSGLAKWKLRAASGGAQGPLSALSWFLSAAGAHLRFKSGMGTHAGLVVAVSGLDGSGKSTLVGRLMTTFRTAGGIQPQELHLLPSWIPMPHQILRRKKTATAYHKPYSEPPVTSRSSALLRLGFYGLAFALARAALAWQTLRGAVVVSDRSFFDFASDLSRARIPHAQLPDWLLRVLVPKGVLCFVDASPDCVVQRKGELTLENATRIRAGYLRTAELSQAVVLDGNASATEVFKQLLAHVSAEYLRRLDGATGQGRR